MLEQMRCSGIDALGEVPWGTHVCQFYQSTQDLLEVLVGYFQQGLRNNEFCMWVASEPLGAEDARSALRQAAPDLEERIRRGQIEFLDYRQWYLPSGRFDVNRVMQGWAEKEREALAHGYEGLRVTGDAFWLDRSDWKTLVDYEAVFNNVVGSNRVLALCTYALDKCRGADIFDVLRNHTLSIINNEGRWEVIQSPQQRKTAEMLTESERRQKAILDTIPDPAWLKDKEGRFLAVNPAWCRFFGKNAEEVLGKTVCDLLPAELAKILTEQDCAVIQSQKPLNIEEVLSDKDGRKVWFETIKSPLFNDCGELLGTTGLARDITDRKHAEEANKRLASVVDSSDDAIISKTLEGIILSWNAGAERIYGYSAEEAVGKHVSILLPPEQKYDVHHILARIGRGEHIVHYETQRVRKDGYRIDVSLTVSPLKDMKGKIIGASTITRDISDRKKAEKARRENEEYLRFALEVSNSGAWDLDLLNHTAHRSLRHDQIFGYVSLLPVWTYKMLLEHVLPEDRGAVDRQFQQAVASKGDWNFECRIRRIDGEIRWIWAAGRHRIDASGKLTRMGGIVRDITEQKQAEKVLRLHSALMETVTEGIFLIGLEDNIIKWTNRKFEELFGYAPGEMIGMHVDQINAPTDKTPTENRIHIVDILRQTGEWHGEIKNVKKDGTHFWSKIHVSLFDHPEFGKVMVSAHADITEEVRNREQVDLLHMELMHAGRLMALGELASGIAHEINQPLTIVTTWAEVAMREICANYDDNKQESILALLRISGAVERVGHIVNYMKDFARKSEVRKSVLSMREMIDEVHTLVASQLRIEGVNVVIDMNADLPLVFADRVQIQQVLLNLIRNATDAMKGTKPDARRLEIRGRIIDVMLEVAAHDSGCGISPESLEKIFLPFQTSKEEGMGLGLTICRTIIEKHGGRIWAASNPDGGAILTFTLPLAKDQMDKASSPESLPTGTSKAQEASEHASDTSRGSAAPIDKLSGPHTTGAKTRSS